MQQYFEAVWAHTCKQTFTFFTPAREGKTLQPCTVRPDSTWMEVVGFNTFDPFDVMKKKLACPSMGSSLWMQGERGKERESFSVIELRFNNVTEGAGGRERMCVRWCWEGVDVNSFGSPRLVQWSQYNTSATPTGESESGPESPTLGWDAPHSERAFFSLFFELVLTSCHSLRLEQARCASPFFKLQL